MHFGHGLARRGLAPDVLQALRWDYHLNLRCTVVRTAIGSENRVFTVNCVQLCDCVAPARHTQHAYGFIHMAPRCHRDVTLSSVPRHTPLRLAARVAPRNHTRSGCPCFHSARSRLSYFRTSFVSRHSSLSHSQTHTPASTLYSHKGGVVRRGRFGSRTMIGAALSASGLFHCDFPVDGQW